MRKRGEVVLTEDHTQGRASERVAWKNQPSTHLNRTLTGRPDVPFRAGAYASLKLDVKYVGVPPLHAPPRAGPAGGPGRSTAERRRGTARAEQQGHDAYGRVEYASYRTPDTRLTRHFVLTAEGYLVVQDVLTTGKAMADWNAGQLAGSRRDYSLIVPHIFLEI